MEGVCSWCLIKRFFAFLRNECLWHDENACNLLRSQIDSIWRCPDTAVWVRSCLDWVVLCLQWHTQSRPLGSDVLYMLWSVFCGVVTISLHYSTEQKGWESQESHKLTIQYYHNIFPTISRHHSRIQCMFVFLLKRNNVNCKWPIFDGVSSYCQL